MSTAGQSRVAFLRPPPFPGAKPVAVSLDDVPAQAAANDAQLVRDRLLALRVGGAFWAPPMVTLAAPCHVLLPTDLAQAQAMHAALRADGAPPWLAIVRPDRDGRAVAAWLGQRGGIVQTGPTDPWSIPPGALSVMGSMVDEGVLVAQMRGMHVRRFAAGDGGEITAPQPDPLETVRQHVTAPGPYCDWFTGACCTALDAIDQLGAWRAQIDANRAIAVASGVAWWKRREIESFLWSDRDQPLAFRQAPGNVLRIARAAGRDIAIWPSRVPAQLLAGAQSAGIAIHQVEDGFIRSVGLGSGLHPPQSVIVDPIGIYYDPTRPSRLEQILEEGDFPPALLARAEALVATIRAEGISKYAAGHGSPLALPADRRTVLVTGQVEDDQSVLLGGGGIAGNLDLLRRARAAEPDAYLIFKPHPDVEAGHRKGAIDPTDAARLADLVLRDGSMAALLDAVDAVHVWTSLAGFEALLRGREVIVHGQPFFAGWGLTRDLAPSIARRTRRVMLLELVAATLILYPRYLDPVTQLPCTPELLISRMTHPGAARRTLLTRARAVQGQISRRIGQWPR